jgi:hypothetical protein
MRKNDLWSLGRGYLWEDIPDPGPYPTSMKPWELPLPQLKLLLLESIRDESFFPLLCKDGFQPITGE